jgi:tetratricopeptide (TPR) repeat protein
MRFRKTGSGKTVIAAATLLISVFSCHQFALAGRSSAGADGSADGKRNYSEDAIRHYNRGHDLHQQGFFNQAITEYKAALAADDRMEESYTNLGLIYAAQRNYNRAIDAFRKSLAINPNRPNALNGLATVLYARNQIDEAMEKWKEAVAIDPHFASAFYNMGNALENEKSYAEAIDAYVHALNINPSMADAYYRVGTLYARQKHLAQASILLSKALQIEPTAEFARDARKTLASLDNELSPGEKESSKDSSDVKMNVIAPQDDDHANHAGGT